MAPAHPYTLNSEQGPPTISTMLKRLSLAFAGTRQRRATTNDAREGNVREIVRAHSHGNIRLQWGQYYTKKDVDAKFDRLRKIDFSR